MPTKKHREKQIEARLIKRVKEHGGKADKFTSPGRRSVPDRIVTMPCTTPPTFFVEAKAPGQVLTPAQEREHKRLRDAGGTVYWVDAYEGIDFLMVSVCDGRCGVHNS